MAGKDEEQIESINRKLRTLQARKHQLQARAASRERARRTHGLVEIGAGIDAKTTVLTFEDFAGDKAATALSRQRLEQALGTRVQLSDGTSPTIAQLIDAAWRKTSQDEPRQQEQPAAPVDDQPPQYEPLVHREYGQS